MKTNQNPTPQPGSTPEGLTARQHKLLRVLVDNPNIQTAARAAGVGRTTAHRWLNEPLFLQELTRHRHAAVTEAMASLQSRTARAAEELTKLLDSPSEWLRRQICMDILNCSQKTLVADQIFQRLDALEKDRETKQSGRKQ